jgi:hypothetical protein
MKNPYGTGKIEDRPNSHTTHNYSRPWPQVLLGDEVRIAVVVFVVLTIPVLYISWPCYLGKCTIHDEFLKGLLIDAHSVLLDLLVIGFVVVWLNRRAQRAHESVQYQEEIDMLRDSTQKEAGIKILYNIRRLNRNGITSIFLAKATFDGLDLRGDGEAWATKNGVDISGSYAPHASFVGAALTGLSLREAELQEANFSDSYCGSVDFAGAELLGANFFNATLTRANFTNARHLTAEQLAKARNLYDAKLDQELEAKVRAFNPSIFDSLPVESSIGSFFEMYTPELLAKDFAEAMKKKKDK